MSSSFPLVEVSVVLVRDEQGRFLMDFNPHWGSFNFPMSKRRAIPPQKPGDEFTAETPIAAAFRAAAEVLGRPLPPKALKKLNVDVPPWNQSGRDGEWKRYTYHLYTITVAGEATPLPGHTVWWMTSDEIKQNEPVSSTARNILNSLV